MTGLDTIAVGMINYSV